MHGKFAQLADYLPVTEDSHLLDECPRGDGLLAHSAKGWCVELWVGPLRTFVKAGHFRAPGTRQLIPNDLRYRRLSRRTSGSPEGRH